MKVLDDGRFRVYVYREVGQLHHLPHCNVRWTDGTSQVSLDDLIEVLAGDPLPRRARRLLRDGIEAVRAAWNQLNPEMPV